MKRSPLLGALAACLAGAALFAAPSRAAADTIHFVNPHPLPPRMMRAMCYIEGPHVHAYRPHKSILYIKRRGGWTFIGDPVEFEPKGPKHAYYGHHPVFWIDDDPRVAIEHYCYIAGPHYHWYAAPRTAHFKIKGGLSFYVGPRPRWYRVRYRRFRPFARYYVAVHIPRPRVVVTPPAGFVAVRFGPRGDLIVGGGVHVGVGVSVPGVTFGFGGPRRGYRAGRPYRRGHPGRGWAWGRRGKRWRRGHPGRGHAYGHRKRKKRKRRGRGRWR